MTKGFNGTVTRRHEGDDTEWTTWIEPPLDERWSDLDKLRWWAAVVTHDTSLNVTVHKNMGDGLLTPVRYTVDIDRTSVAMTGLFQPTWDYMAGILAGAQAARFHDQHAGMFDGR